MKDHPMADGYFIFNDQRVIWTLMKIELSCILTLLPILVGATSPRNDGIEPDAGFFPDLDIPGDGDIIGNICDLAMMRFFIISMDRAFTLPLSKYLL